ncbi:uncharacterized protein LOC116113788 isoform X2 [Pistacia vera]|uniref:uncharacterized protein LOC116113788 isoform X2 n=1 Tax=Pistacia vera TaxID=55513 RepID=UPI001262AECF|nr:uncharacterized protein LOC116113788 isoform X2 [Pistacia vera]
MAYCRSKMIGAPLPLASCGKDLIDPPVIVSTTKTRVLLPLQVRNNLEQKLQKPETNCISRRDTMLCMTAKILSGVALLSADPAEARVQKLERKRKIMEKLEKLREKAGVSKPKIENGKQTPLPPKRPANPQQGSVQPLVESILP